jgi:hypothetical protein
VNPVARNDWPFAPFATAAPEAIMPRYFFNHRSQDGERALDIDGLRLDSLHSALDEATFAAQGAMVLADAPLRGEIEIEDEGRVVVARVPYRVTWATEDETADNGMEAVQA